MTIFTGTTEAGERVAYRDGKRWLWLWMKLLFLIPFSAGLLYLATGNALATLIPFLWVFGAVPLIDRIMGEDEHNPPEAVVPAMSADRFYMWVPIAAIPLHYLLFIGAAWLVASHDLPWWSVLAIVLGIGTMSGNAITIGHELGHKQERFYRTMAKLSLGVVGYGHFCIEHNRGHHVKVATPEDCSSARMGETVFAFALRDIPGALKGAIAHESLRLRNRGKSFWHPENEILQSWAITLAVALVLVAWLGLAVVPFIIAHHFIAWYGLTQVNYIEHYGLKRRMLPNGRYEPCQPHHSWNTNHIFSNLMQIHLQRHSDHHANPQRPYQALRNFEKLPRLPSGYPGCLGLANIPPLWFRIMDKRVMAWAGGDLDNVNIDPAAEDRLRAKWG
ncbi:alkane 1-monooxygenase [Aquisalinus flavus]|uniref:Alkane monooxygenase n=1 Tax=Aquisalinus flavus TaxID=1526572 RepID=A0A8J2V236_9PROT|nr:alkane 1-monooxygenase [Aquisalinus flavus]MBD0425549.1 alkane 1-monooxygenase [Aquisalinus flavus]UNE48824.1 alkane 1-monooxygenase [Aquisalinus flavus]GGD15192.1 alkane monooxygenase [Aquisalinus flavus]